MTALSAVGACGAVLALGLGVSLAAFPAGGLGLTTRIASVFGLGCATVTFAATLLVLLGIFEPTAVVIVLVLAGAAAWFVGLRRAGPRDHLRALRDDVRAEGLFGWLGLAVLVLIAVAWAAVPLLPTAGGWRYWADGLELADVGGVPSFTAQWGEALPPAVSKLGGNAFLGSLSFAFADHPFTGMAVALWLSAVGYAAGLLALARELGLRRTAPVVPLVGLAGFTVPGGVVLNAEIAHKLEFFQHEDLGRMLAATAAAMVVARSVPTQSVTRAVAAAAVLAAAALTHMIPVVAFGALIVGVLAVQAALGPRRSDVARLAAAGIFVMVVLTIAPLVIAGGEVGFSGATNPERYVLVDGTYDPTAKVKGLTRAPRPKSEQRWYDSPGTIARYAAEASVGRSLDGVGAVLLAVGAALAAGALAAFGTGELRLLAAGAGAMAIVLLVVALVFSYRYALWVQATVGERRLFEYASVPLMLIGAGVVEVAALKLAGLRTAAGYALALAAFVAVLVGAIGALGVTDKTGSLRYVTAAAATPCDSRLLVDQGTRGTFQSLAGRISVTEGLVPFLRPNVVNRVLELRERSRRFFEDPDASTDLLAELEVDYVVSRVRGSLRGARSLRLVRRLGGIVVYEVREPPATRNLPRPTKAAGYRCVTAAASS